jgi:Spore germination protein gerPA/gerPF
LEKGEKMPAFVGPVKLNELDSSAIFKVGDTFSLSPKSSDKTSVGSGSANTGDFIQTQNLFNITNFYDADIIDQPSIINK